MLIPRLTTMQRTGISPAANGLLVFDADTKSFGFTMGWLRCGWKSYPGQ
ncbi:MAG: hypothetical protein IPH36_12780 [Saprospiraceae bacterium]|nr:hypothetical protein [Saprospiraceae bacterium]